MEGVWRGSLSYPPKVGLVNRRLRRNVGHAALKKGLPVCLLYRSLSFNFLSEKIKYGTKVRINLNKLLTLPKIFFVLARKKKNIAVDPEYLKKQKASLLRRHRQVIYLNDNEMAVIEEYCRRFNVHTKASLYRTAIISRLLQELDENHPTLF